MLHELEVKPGRGWRVLRRLSQVTMILAILVSPLLGGWQRLDRSRMATWERGGSELPADLAQRLPLGEAARRAHRTNRLLGGGLGVELLGIPVADPVAGTFALLRAGATPRAWLAVGLPILLALLAGRVFCGWFCPFGTLARGLGRVLDRLRWPHFRIPESRPVRWLVLIVALGAGLVGSHFLLYLSLPHLLVQQTVYRAWLLGGGSAILGVLIGLLIATALFGATTYCASVCPTGAALSGLGRWRTVRLRIAKVQDCGLHCVQCDRACWLQLNPTTGDPGPDCDLCARCVGACPRSNLRVGIGRGRLKVAGQVGSFAGDWNSGTGARSAPVTEKEGLGQERQAAGLGFLGPAVFLALTLPFTADAIDKPRLVLRGGLERDGVTVAVSAVDLAGVRLGADSAEVQSGVELSVFVARGVRGPADERGRLPSREVYDGPLEVRIEPARGGEVQTLRLPAPNSPRSTPNRAVYRWRALDRKLKTGDVVELMSISGWLESPVSWRIPEPDLPRSAGAMFRTVLAATLGFSGLLSLALAVRPKYRQNHLAGRGVRPGPRKERR